MNKIKHYFGSYDMSWKKVILFSIIVAIYTALINQVTFLKNTSFRDIAINFECWFLFAIFIIVNAKSRKEACLKCFVFFLISQPIIYLIEVPFSSEGFAIFRYYKTWGIWTLLTIPGSLICYELKRKNLISVLVLSVVIVYLSYMVPYYLKSVIYNFPHHLLSTIFCFVLAIFLSYVLFDNKKYTIILIAIFLVCTCAFYIISDKKTTVKIKLDEGNWTYKVENDKLCNTTLINNELIIKPLKDGMTYLYLINDNNITETYLITISAGDVMVNYIEE